MALALYVDALGPGKQKRTSPEKDSRTDQNRQVADSRRVDLSDSVRHLLRPGWRSPPLMVFLACNGAFAQPDSTGRKAAPALIIVECAENPPLVMHCRQARWRTIDSMRKPPRD
jgi:hypothetical protein